MTSPETGPGSDVMAALPSEADHRLVEDALLADGWTRGGVGDWALVLGSPDGAVAARISPFDPAGPYTAAFYREAASTGQVPALWAHRRLSGGGDLQLMEWLVPVPTEEAARFHRAMADRSPLVADLVAIVERIHARALRELPWCGPLDTNPTNVMAAADGRLVVIDPFYADGPNLYATAASDPDLVVERIPENERRFMTEIPLDASGPWDPVERAAMLAGLLAADARAASHSHGRTST